MVTGQAALFSLPSKEGSGVSHIAAAPSQQEWPRSLNSGRHKAVLTKAISTVASSTLVSMSICQYRA